MCFETSGGPEWVSPWGMGTGRRAGVWHRFHRAGLSLSQLEGPHQRGTPGPERKGLVWKATREATGRAGRTQGSTCAARSSSFKKSAPLGNGDGGWSMGSDGSREGGRSLSGDTGRGKASLPVAWACQGVWAACSQPPTLSMQEEQSPCVWAA